jgi:hypothetical protein
MKRTLLSVFVLLALTMVWEGSQLFASGIFAVFGKPEQAKVGELADIAEVLPQDYPIRANPNTRLAGGNIYADRAQPLNPAPQRLPPPVVAIAGVKNVELIKDDPMIVDIIVTLPEKVTFSRGILEGEDVSDWITNLPAGLEALAHGVKKGAKTIRIYVSGTPTVTMREVVRVTIPGTYLTGGTDRQFVSPTEEESFNTWQKSQTE